MELVEQKVTLCFEQDRLRLLLLDSLIWIVSDLHFDKKVVLFFICGIKIFLSFWPFYPKCLWSASNNHLQMCAVNQYDQSTQR